MNYVIVSLVRGLEKNQAFRAWPLHITLSPIFSTDNISTLTPFLEAVAIAYRPFAIEVGKPNLFGPKHNIPVLEISPNPQLSSLHRAIYEIVEPFKTSNKPGQFWLENYKPHITNRKRLNSINSGDEIIINSFGLFEYINIKHKTKVLKHEFKLVIQ